MATELQRAISGNKHAGRASRGTFIKMNKAALAWVKLRKNARLDFITTLFVYLI